MLLRNGSRCLTSQPLQLTININFICCIKLVLYVSNVNMHLGWMYTRTQHYFAIPPAVSFLISLSCYCPLPFSYTVVSLSELSELTQIRLSPGSAIKGSYVQWWQELISNFLHNDCIISSDSGNLAYITEAAGGCRSGWQLSSPGALLTEITEREIYSFSRNLVPSLMLPRSEMGPVL